MSDDKPLSHLYWTKAKQYVKLDAVARRLEEEKTTVLEDKKCKLIGESNEPMAENKAERIVKASQEWKDYIRAMVDAWTAANDLKHELAAINMRHQEKQSEDANRRAEMKLV